MALLEASKQIPSSRALPEDQAVSIHWGDPLKEVQVPVKGCRVAMRQVKVI